MKDSALTKLAIPGVVVRADQPGKLCYLLIEMAIERGWDDSLAYDLAVRGRVVTHGLEWRSTAKLDDQMCRLRPHALAWLRSNALVSGATLEDNGDAIVLHPAAHSHRPAA
jgi:hypothetical protein